MDSVNHTAVDGDLPNHIQGINLGEYGMGCGPGRIYWRENYKNILRSQRIKRSIKKLKDNDFISTFKQLNLSL